MKALDGLVWKTIRGLLWLAAKTYNVRVYGLEKVDASKAAVFAVRHPSNADLPLILHVLPKKATIFATKGIFVNPFVNYLLTVSGVVPRYDSLNDEALKLNPINIAANRTFYNTLSTAGFVVYAPEAKRVLKGVGENIRPEMLMKAAKLGYATYLVGVRYGNGGHPFFSFIRWPRIGGIEVRIEEYSAANKTPAQVSDEMRHALARLSGLEQKLEATLTARDH
ncbi:1-acyl-sn-glycerol-3-phosphate acyltransferase [Candidatus Woesearchaeota archaeon]|nr:1-acyl-sn-glycerol-3-phosphate acyltransferase [Candidatus Woesearchaeota archaeon]